MNIAIFGASGRMGQQLLAAASEAGAQTIACTRAKPNEAAMLAADVVIDFSTPAASRALLERLAAAGEAGEAKLPALLVGTTGLDEGYFALAKQHPAPYFWASNTSIGVAVLNELSARAARLLGGFDIEICEHHHKHKIDAPSGTALSLARTLEAASGKKAVFGRAGARDADEIGVVATRGGDVAGRHVVGFYGDGEWLELQHYATSRAVFAKGAVRIAEWLVRQERGCYGMKDFIATVL